MGKLDNNYAISGGHEITIEVAQNILEAGGNAYDAAIAAYLASFVTEPCMASAGACGFANIFTKDKEAWVADFFCQTPEFKNPKASDLTPITIDFGTSQEVYYAGVGSFGVPGAIKFIFDLHHRFATMSLKELASQAIDLAKNGVALNTFQALDLKLLEQIFALDLSVREIFFKENGILKEEGDTLRFSNYASFLEALCSEGEGLFYKGEISQWVAEKSKQENGHIRRSDFEKYQVYWAKPLCVNFGQSTLNLPPQSSIGTWIMANVIKSIQESLETKPPKRTVFIKDIYNIFENVMGYNNDLELLKAHFLSGVTKSSGHQSTVGGTSHFNILDKWGNGIALTTTIGEGSGYFIPGTDMQMNNILGETALLPDKKIGAWKPNARLHSMMTPCIVLDDNQNINYLMGSGGADRIPYVLSQVLLNQLVFGMDLTTANEAPRMYNTPDCLHIEKGVDIDLKSKEVKEWREKSLFFGGVHTLSKDKNGKLNAVGDARRYGRSIIKM